MHQPRHKGRRLAQNFHSGAGVLVYLSTDCEGTGWTPTSAAWTWQVALDKSQKNAKQSAATFFANARVPTRIDSKHAIAQGKGVIVCGHTVHQGSFNYTKAAEESNEETCGDSALVHLNSSSDDYVNVSRLLALVFFANVVLVHALSHDASPPNSLIYVIGIPQRQILHRAIWPEPFGP